MEWELHLVKWSTVCMEKKNKGPGLKILSNLKKGAWWDEVIAGKYGKEEGGGILVFQGMVLEWVCGMFLRKWGHLMSNRFSFAVGNRKRVKHWMDRWMVTPHLTFSPLCSLLLVQRILGWGIYGAQSLIWVFFPTLPSSDLLMIRRWRVSRDNCFS